MKNQKGFGIIILLLIIALWGLSGLIGLSITRSDKKIIPEEHKSLPSSITQGVKGVITLRSGDCMPMVGGGHNSCKIETYRNPSKVIIKKPLDLTNKEIKEVVKELSEVKGEFEAELPVGLYSMYVIYKGREYCNLFGGQRGEDCEFSVEANKVTNYTLQINEATD